MISILFCLLLVTFIYLTPGIIAVFRRLRNRVAIIVLNAIGLPPIAYATFIFGVFVFGLDGTDHELPEWTHPLAAIPPYVVMAGVPLGMLIWIVCLIWSLLRDSERETGAHPGTAGGFTGRAA